MRRRAWLVAALTTSLVGCGDVLFPTAVFGTYELRSIGGVAPPGLLYLTPTDSVLISARTLVLHANGEYSQESALTVVTRASGVARDTTALEVGAYRMGDHRIALYADLCRDIPACALLSYAPVEYVVEGRWLELDAPAVPLRLERTGGPRAR